MGRFYTVGADAVGKFGRHPVGSHGRRMREQDAERARVRLKRFVTFRPWMSRAS